MALEWVPFVCPDHGFVVMAKEFDRFEHSCGQECVPPGKTLREHRRAVSDYRMARRAPRRRSKPNPA